MRAGAAQCPYPENGRFQSCPICEGAKKVGEVVSETDLRVLAEIRSRWHYNDGLPVLRPAKDIHFLLSLLEAAQKDLAECYRLSGADPAVAEVRRIRQAYDEMESLLVAAELEGSGT